MKRASPKTRSQILSYAPTDFVSVALAYADEAIADTKHLKHGRYFRLAAKRFRADLKLANAKNARFTFNSDWANRACRFIECLPHVEGKWETPTIKLHPAHVFFVVNLFGFRSPDGSVRRFTTALLATARKNAKSTAAAGIALACECLEDEEGAQVISAATTGSQARIIFNVAKKMVEKTATLRETFTLEPVANAIIRHEIGGVFKPINAKASTQDGLNPSVCVLDEVHAHKNHDLLNVLQSAAGARAAPLFLFTTTEGYENPGPWAEIRNYSQQLLKGLVEGDHFLVCFFAVDEEDKEAGIKADDDFNEASWIKANPLMTVNPHLITAIRKEAAEARSMPGKLAEFRIKRLNRRAASAEAWINLTKWNKGNRPVEIDDMEGLPCWAGLDLASTTDMCALRFLWQRGDEFYTWGRYWLPEDAVKRAKAKGNQTYQSWAEAGLLTLTSGEVTDYDQIERELLADYARFSPKKIAFDPWNAQQMANSLVEKGVPMEQFIQGTKSYHPAMQNFETIYTAGKLAHAGNPVLTWNMANLVARKDANENLAPSRKNSAGKIDGAVALIMACGLQELGGDSGDAAGFYSRPAIG